MTHRHGPGRGHHGRGPEFWTPPQGFPFFRPPFAKWMSSHKARRGDARAAVLLLLAEQPRNGYQLMQEVEQRSNGVWRPSPGSMYPVLAQLADEGLIEPTGEGGRLYSLTKAGKQYVDEHADELGTPWETQTDDDEGLEMRAVIGKMMMAAGMIMRTGNAKQLEEARALLVETRRKLFQILAEDSPE